MPDGSQPNPFPLVAVQVPVDRLPDSKTQVPTMLLVFIVAFQPANVRASQPVAVSYPNTMNTAPGTNMPLLTLDPTRGSMVPYGTGTVSANGTQVVPDPDPAVPGHRYGIVNFDWHGQMPSPTPPGQTFPDPSTTCDGGCPPPPVAGDPVDLASGLQTYNVTDIAIAGGRGTISVQRIYRTLSTNAGPFGRGTQHNYNSFVTLTGSPVQFAELINPDNSRYAFNGNNIFDIPNAGRAFTLR